MVRKPLDSDSFQKSRRAANARERIRMRILSRAFTRLKMSLPWVPKDTKLSKLDTLRLATCYIRYLRQVVNKSSADEEIMSPDCAQMIWPLRQSSSVQASCEVTNEDCSFSKRDERDTAEAENQNNTVIDGSF